MAPYLATVHATTDADRVQHPFSEIIGELVEVTTATLTKPTALPVIPENIPSELIDLDRWVVWKWWWDGTKWTKPPYLSRAPSYKTDATNPENWSSFAKALWTYQQGLSDGIGFALTPEIHITGIDRDHTLDLTLCSCVDSYWEVSPSGTGLRCIARGNLPGDGRKENGREMYDDVRYLTITGHHITGTPNDIRAVQPEIDALYAEWFPPKAPKKDTHAGGASSVEFNGTRLASPSGDWWTDDEIIDIAHRAQDGAKFDRLMTGNASDYLNPATGQPDRSRADGGLAAILHFYCRGDVDQVERIMRKSSLPRDKWDRVIPSYETTYLRYTIATVPSNGNFYAYTPVRLHSNGVPHNPEESAPAEPDVPEAIRCPNQAAELAVARARIAELERENARIPALEAALADTRADLAALRVVQSQTMAVHRNPKAKAIGPVALALANSVKASTSPGPTKIYIPEVANRAGRSLSAVSRAITDLQGAGLLDKYETREPSKTRANVEVTRVSIELKDSPGVFLEKVASYEPPKVIRTPTRRRCPHHPNAEILAQLTCRECGDTFSERVIYPEAIDEQDETTDSATPADPILSTESTPDDVVHSNLACTPTVDIPTYMPICNELLTTAQPFALPPSPGELVDITTWNGDYVKRGTVKRPYTSRFGVPFLELDDGTAIPLDQAHPVTMAASP